MNEPKGVVLYDQEADRLLEGPAVFHVEHEGRTRELRLRVARGTIRDVLAPDLPPCLGEPEVPVL